MGQGESAMMRDSGLAARESGLLAATLRNLEQLVAFDTRNPPRRIGSGGIFEYLCRQLSGFELDLIDHGAGAVSLLALRGRPKLLFNVHRGHGARLATLDCQPVPTAGVG